MESRQKKCKADESGGDEISKGTSHFTEADKNLVFNIVSRYLNCPRLLRTCRLVSKSWNESACAVLRTFPIFLVDADWKKFETLKNLKTTQLSKSGNWPRPFRKICLRLNDFSTESFMNIREYCNQKFAFVSELHVAGIFPGGFFLVGLLPLIKFLRNSLVTLILHQFPDFKSPDDLKRLRSVQFVCLKTLRIESSGESLKSSPSHLRIFVENIVANSKLELLQLPSLHFHVLEDILSSIKLEAITSFELEYDLNRDKNLELAGYFLEKPIHNLTKFSVRSTFNRVTLSQLILTVSDSLQVLELKGARISMDILPACPNVKELICELRAKSWEIRLLPQKFPKLNKLTIRGAFPFYGEQVPHIETLEHLDIEIGGLQVTHLSKVTCKFCEMLIIGGDLGAQKSLTVNRGKWCSQMRAIISIGEYFPCLKSLRLSKILALDNALQVACSLPKEKYYQTDALVDELFPMRNFLNLQKLQLHEITVSPTILRSSISRMPNLQQLKFEKYEEITTDVIQENLSHLTEIVMLSCSKNDEHNPNMLPRIQKLLMERMRRPRVTFYCDRCDWEIPLCQCSNCRD